MNFPVIIQGGMGIGVSNWRLARSVSLQGELGVVSGTALSSVLVRRLQNGDPDGVIRRALSYLPIAKIADRIIQAYFIPNGIRPGATYKRSPMYSLKSNRHLDELTIAANFVEVFLAKEGHNGRVGINFLEKIQLPHLTSIYGALLANVDFVLMGAGIPREIPGVLDRLAAHQPSSLSISVESAPAGTHKIHFDPNELFDPGEAKPVLKRPKFLAIISSSVLAKSLISKASGWIDGFVAEGPAAGGHNAPPRGKAKLNLKGEPIYTERDKIDLNEMRQLGRPFWLAGSFASPSKLREALASGASGIQVGTAFALCRESGIEEKIKSSAFEKIRQDSGLEDLVYTDAMASPTGMPFKVFNLSGSMSDSEVYAIRPRKCDLGFLRKAYLAPNGRVGYRCPGEPVEHFKRKGGLAEETIGKKCLCNSLLALVDLGQAQEDGYLEKPLLTSGEDLFTVKYLLGSEKLFYTAKDVVEFLRT